MERYGLERAIKLASNENPWGSSPKAVECARVAAADMSRYPDGGLELRKKLAERFCVKLENVIAGSGSEGIMADIIRTFLADDDEILTTEAAFQGFQVLARGRGVPYRTVPYRAWRYDLDALARAITVRTKLIYLANPNNPTGTFFTREEFERFYKRVPSRVLIILDEAYFEFARHESACPDSMHYRYDNVITLRTFSKAYGLAGARVGYGFGHDDLISVLLKVKLPFEPSGPGAAAAMGALDDGEFLEETVRRNREGVRFLRESLEGLGFDVVPSVANFVVLAFQTEQQGGDLFENLLARGVIVRPLAACGLPHCLRVSCGTHEQNQIFIEAVKRTQIDALRKVNAYASY